MFGIFLSLVFLSGAAAAPGHGHSQNLTWWTHPGYGCGGVFRDSHFALQSPGYPGRYPGAAFCEYTLVARCPSAVFRFDFEDFDLGPSPACRGDRLEVDRMEVVCGTTKGSRFYAVPDGVMKLRFRSALFGNGRGFRILVHQQKCEQNAELPPELPVCCARVYNSPRFYLASPSFPSRDFIPSDCTFPIYPSSVNVCRVRLHFEYFLVGRPSGQCDGFLEIDGNRICGCRTGLNLIARFNPGSGAKILRFHNPQPSREAFSGFAVEVIQDECPIRYDASVEGLQLLVNDQKERVGAIEERAEILDDTHSPDIRVDRYYYEARDKEPNGYVDLSPGLGAPLPGGEQLESCRRWDLSRWILLSRQALWQRMPRCDGTSSNMEKCVELSNIRGFIESPGYPYPYASNLNHCYRLHKQPGFCGFKLAFDDFDLEQSYQCQKDYLLLGANQRYCGHQLMHMNFEVKLESRDYEDLHLVSDRFGCGRGFRGLYEQQPCPSSGEDPRSSPGCGGLLGEARFRIRLEGYTAGCRYVLSKYDEGVCKVRLQLITFDLPCGNDHLLANNKQYCGRMSGNTVEIKFEDSDTINLDFQSSGFNFLNILIDGEQLMDDCDDVPVQRLYKPREKCVVTTYEIRSNNKTLDDGSDGSLCSLIFVRQDGFCSLRIRFLVVREKDTSQKCPTGNFYSGNVEICPTSGTEINEAFISDTLSLSYEPDASNSIEFDQIRCEAEAEEETTGIP